MDRINYSRAERKEQIIMAILVKIQNGLPNALTVYSAAKSLKMRPSTHLKSILMDMVNEGELEVTTVFHRPNSDKLVFSLPQTSLLNLELPTRKIKINGKAVDVAQARLF